MEGNEGWDYLAVDAVNQHLFVSHGNVVHVIDLKSDQIIETIPDTKGVHGIAIANDLNKAFISNGKDNSITVVNLKTFELIEKVNPKCAIVFTVSPVRHIKDGFVENQRSKANLISALHSTFDIRHAIQSYFPSYEIMMDELRDYRFYSEDMLHPNQVAISYIWNRFCETTISNEANLIMTEVESIQRGLSHRPFNPNSESHLKFLNQLELKVSKLKSEFPFMNFQL